MERFTGYEYILIDIANAYGLDKELFSSRIEWAKQNLDKLEQLAIDKGNWKEKPLYIKAVMALRKAQRGEPTGHLVGFDACCSGIQVMSVLTGCHAGARATGLVDPNMRSDAYTYTTSVMNEILGGGINITRKQAKDALMTSFYGSKAVPKALFGEDTPELDAFYAAAQRVAPGAWDLLQDLLASWQPHALEHSWKLPDGFDARVKVMQKVEDVRIEVDELDHATFTYEYYENKGSKKGLSNVANVVHSVDAYVLRTLHRRCNYNLEVVETAQRLIDIELIKRSMKLIGETEADEAIGYYSAQYERSTMADIVVLPFLTAQNIGGLSTEHLQKLLVIVNGMLEYKPFEVITIHDEFKCHPNNMNHLRQQYINVFAELADSELLSDLLSQVSKTQGTYQKASNNLGEVIRGSNYALS